MHKLLDQIVEMTGYRPRVLVVDDDLVTVAILHMIFQRRVDVLAASSHAATLEQCHNLRPDLILLDINLGDEDGFDLCHLIKQQPALAGIPVIFITGSHDQADEVRAFQLGAVDFMRKPIAPFIAESRVITHLALQLVCLSHPALAHRAIVKPRGSPPKPRDYRSLGAKRVSRDADGGASFDLLQQRRSAPLQARANAMARQASAEAGGHVLSVSVSQGNQLSVWMMQWLTDSWSCLLFVLGLFAGDAPRRVGAASACAAPAAVREMTIPDHVQRRDELARAKRSWMGACASEPSARHTVQSARIEATAASQVSMSMRRPRAFR